MSAWRALVRSLHVSGPSNGRWIDSRTACKARDMGLIERDDDARWVLTPFGVEWCDGRVELVGWRGGRRWVATWLRALPQGVSLQPPEK